MSNKLIEKNIILPKEAWQKEARYEYINDRWNKIFNVEKAYQWFLTIEINDIEKYDFLYDDDISINDIFGTLDGSEFVQFVTLEEPKEDISIKLKPKV